MHHTILQRGRVPKVLASPIQGHTSILESDPNQNGTPLFLTDNIICYNIVWPIHFLQACRKCTWKPYVLSCLAMGQKDKANQWKVPNGFRRISSYHQAITVKTINILAVASYFTVLVEKE